MLVKHFTNWATSLALCLKVSNTLHLLSVGKVMPSMLMNFVSIVSLGANPVVWDVPFPQVIIVFHAWHTGS